MSQAGGGKLIIDIDGDTKELEQALDRLDSVGSAALGALAAGFAALGAGFTVAAGKSLQLASDLQEVQNVVDVTFGEGAKQIQAFADAAGDTFGLSELQAKKYSSTLGAMMKSMGLTSDEVLDMSQNLTGLAGDFASFYNLDHQTAFDKIRSGLSGETEPLMQLGINMQVASLEAYALSKGIQTAFKDMTAAEKAILRYNYLLEASADAQGDFARTSAGYANQLRIAGMEVETLGVAFGKTLLPIATEALGGIIEATKELTQEFETSGLKESVAAVGQGFADIAVSMTEGLVSAIPTVVDALKLVLDNMGLIVDLTKLYITLWVGAKIAGAIGLVVTALQTAGTATGLLTTATQALNAAWLANPIGLVTRALAILGTAIVTLYHTNEEFRKGFLWAWNNIVEGLENTVNGIIQHVFKPFGDAYAGLLEFLGMDTTGGPFDTEKWKIDLSGWKADIDEASNSIDEMGNKLEELGNTPPEKNPQVAVLQNQLDEANVTTTELQSKINGTGSGEPSRGLQLSEEPEIKQHEQDLEESLSKLDLSKAGKTTANSFSDALSDGLKDSVDTLGNTVYDVLNAAAKGEEVNIGESFAEVGKNMLLSLGNSLIDNATELLGDAIQNVAKYAIGLFSDLMGIASPSKVFQDFGYWMDKGLAQGLEDNTDLLNKPLSNMKSSISGVFDSVNMTQLQSTFSGMVGTPQLSAVGAGNYYGGGNVNLVINNNSDSVVSSEVTSSNQDQTDIIVTISKAVTARQNKKGTPENALVSKNYGLNTVQKR